MMQAHAVSLAIGDRTLVRALDWRVGPGESWVVIGRNGAGKSTLLRALAGLAAPAAGHVDLDGRALSSWSLIERARRCGYLPQGRTDSFGYRAIDTVLAARYAQADAGYWDGAADHAAAMQALTDLDVDGLAGRDVRTLSGGERQRVAIAALLVQDTPLMLLDEPANALDLAHQMALMDLLARLTRDRGKTLVMVSHDLNLAARVATHALLLMGDGAWLAGPCATTMTADALGTCLGHAVEAVPHRGRTLFIPSETSP
jgi:iron complex transport system ATP-binding protein